VICPPDVLCRWLRQEERWETMEELATALRKEVTRNGWAIRGNPFFAEMMRERPSPKIERMMSLACPKRRRLG
jgi:hypothetical protein